MNNERISELDALRGIAAFTVLLNHCFAIYPGVYEALSSKSVSDTGFLLKLFSFSPLHIFWNGHAAVILFFVLSGFVLSISHYNGLKFYYWSYLIKRICRLYIPYFVIITISVLLLNFYEGNHSTEQISYQFTKSWNARRNTHDYINLLLLQGKIDIVNFPLWTVIIEIEIAIILPFFIKIIKRLNFYGNLIFIGAYLALVKLATHTVTDLDITARNLYYLPFFLFGSLLYKHRTKFKNLRVVNVYYIIIVFISIAVLCDWEWLIVWFVKYDKANFLVAVSDYMVAIGSVLLIIICISSFGSIRKVLNTAVFQFMGKISYSLYLIHVVVILFVLFCFRSINYKYQVFIIIASCLLVSYCYYLCIERPSVRLGKYLALMSRSKS